MLSAFLSSYRNTRESLEELEKAVETVAGGPCSHSISRSPKLPLVFDRNTVQRTLNRKKTKHILNSAL